MTLWLCFGGVVLGMRRGRIERGKGIERRDMRERILVRKDLGLWGRGWHAGFWESWETGHSPSDLRAEERF
jgi:hypothetical protein